MLGLLTLGLTVFMIYSLVKNALFGKQLSGDDTYLGWVELIIPITNYSEFYLEPWMKALNSFRSSKGVIRIHILIQNDHPTIEAWKEVSTRLPHVELHVLSNKPAQAEPVPWMIAQVAPLMSADVIIIGDAELVPTEAAFMSVAKLVIEKRRPVYVLPQTTTTQGYLGEAISVLNPTLALASVFGLGKIRKRLSYPLMSIAQGWMGMSRETFKKLNFGAMTLPSWKEGLSKTWEQESETFMLVFGEKQLKRFFAEDVKTQINQLKSYWGELWGQQDKTGPTLFVIALFVWSFPVLCIFTHPFWALASILLLMLYRFFSKIVFQESLIAIALHPLACVAWIGTLIWWSLTGRATKQQPRRFNA